MKRKNKIKRAEIKKNSFNSSVPNLATSNTSVKNKIFVSFSSSIHSLIQPTQPAFLLHAHSPIFFENQRLVAFNPVVSSNVYEILCNDNNNKHQLSETQHFHHTQNDNGDNSGGLKKSSNFAQPMLRPLYFLIKPLNQNSSMSAISVSFLKGQQQPKKEPQPAFLTLPSQSPFEGSGGTRGSKRKKVKEDSKELNADTSYGAFTCERCGKMFKLSHQLKSHIQTHDTLHHYVCDICHKK